MSASSERRFGQDRRQLDFPSTDNKERRRLVESRKSTIIEMTISDDEWASYFGNLPRTVGEHQVSDEEAAAIRERAGD